MRILQINSVSGYGSTGRIAKDIAQRMEQKGDECLIAYGRKLASGEQDGLLIGSRLGVAAHGLLTRLTDRHGFGSRGDTLRAVSEFEKYSPDIIHLHNLHGYYINLPVLFDYLRRSGKPVVWTLHDCWAFTGHCTYYDFEGCSRWLDGCHDCPLYNTYPASITDKSASNWQKKRELFTSLDNLTLVAPSQWLADEAKRSFLSKYPVRVVYNGINLEGFAPTPSDFAKRHGLEGKRIVLGLANVWEPRKGFSDMLRLADALGEDYRVVLVGLTEKQMKEVPANVTGITRTASVRELAEIYTAADVFVNPTKEETLGLTNIEALACGTPVIAYRSGGCPETLSDKCGIVVDRGDVDQIARLILSGAYTQFSRENCVARAAEFDRAHQCDGYEALYRELYSH